MSWAKVFELWQQLKGKTEELPDEKCTKTVFNRQIKEVHHDRKP